MNTRAWAAGGKISPSSRKRSGKLEYEVSVKKRLAKELREKLRVSRNRPVLENPENMRAMDRRHDPTIIDVMTDTHLFGSWFRGESWNSWFAFLKALFGLPMSDEEQAIFTEHTGRSEAQTQPAREPWLVGGGRGGKSLIAALVVVYLACLRDYRSYLAPGEVATIAMIASDRRQARVVHRYIKGFLESVAMLKAMITRQTAESIELSNRVVIEIHSASFRAVRGYSLAATVCDEIAFWRSEESANPDAEIINGLRP